jgi:glycine cleavage system pyridoxal-binding protein P
MVHGLYTLIKQKLLRVVWKHCSIIQTMVCDLTGMSIANASLLDESTAAAEAMSLLFAVRSRTQKKNAIAKFFVDQNTLPQTLSLLETRFKSYWD